MYVTSAAHRLSKKLWRWFVRLRWPIRDPNDVMYCNSRTVGEGGMFRRGVDGAVKLEQPKTYTRAAIADANFFLEMKSRIETLKKYIWVLTFWAVNTKQVCIIMGCASVKRFYNIFDSLAEIPTLLPHTYHLQRQTRRQTSQVCKNHTRIWWVNGARARDLRFTLEQFTARTATQPDIYRPSCPTLTYCSAKHDDKHRKYAKITHDRVVRCRHSN